MSISTSLTPSPVIDAMNDYYTRKRTNIHRGAYRLSAEVTELYENTHTEILKFLDAPSSHSMILTNNTTQAINMVAIGLDRDLLGKDIVVTSMEHHSNLLPWMKLARHLGVRLRRIPIEEDLTIDTDRALEIMQGAGLLAVTHVSNVSGYITPVEKLVSMAKDMNMITLVDGAQAVGHIPVSISKINPDFYAFSGHKGIMGPTGTGGLIYNRYLEEHLSPIFPGGRSVESVNWDGYRFKAGYERYEGGTPNIGGAIGLLSAVEYVKRIGCDRIQRHERKLIQYLRDKMIDLQGIILYTPPKKNSTGILSFNISGYSPHDVAIILDELDRIAVRSGFHCAQPFCLDLGMEEGCIRVSLHAYNNRDDIERFINTLSEIVGR